MAAKRRQRRKYTWFPTIGSVGRDGEDTADDIYGQIFTVEVPADGEQIVAILPVVPDAPRTSEPGLGPQANSLEDIIGNEWMLERIVGKLDIFNGIASNPSLENSYTPNANVAAGFFVSRADHSTPDLPIGDAADLTEDYSPLNANTVREPWLWHRSWSMSAGIVGTEGYNSGIPVALRAGPVPDTGAFANWFLTGTNNNNLIDTSSVRKIGQDDRLYFALAAQINTYGQPVGDTPTSLFCQLFVRVLGRVMRARNDGKF